MLQLISPWTNGRHFTDDIFKRILLIGKSFIFFYKILPKLVPKGPIDDNPALV